MTRPDRADLGRTALLAALTLVLQAGCASQQSAERRETEADLAAGCPSAPAFLFEDGRFNGVELTGRALIGAHSREVWVHPLSASSVSFHVSRVVDCQSHAEVPYLLVDVTGGCVKPADCEPLRLRRGYWYGSNFRYPVVHGEPRECVEVTIGLSLPPQEPEVPMSELRLRAKRNGPVKMVSSSCSPTEPSTPEPTTEDYLEQLKKPVE